MVVFILLLYVIWEVQYGPLCQFTNWHIASQLLVINDRASSFADLVEIGFPPGNDSPLCRSTLPKNKDFNGSHAPSQYSALGNVSSIHIIVLTMSARAPDLVGAVPECMCDPQRSPSPHTRRQCHFCFPSHHQTSAKMFLSSSLTSVAYLFPELVIIDSYRWRGSLKRGRRVELLTFSLEN